MQRTQARQDEQAARLARLRSAREILGPREREPGP